MTWDNQAVVLEVQWNLIGPIAKTPGLSANAPTCIHQPAEAKDRLADLIPESPEANAALLTAVGT